MPPTLPSAIARILIAYGLCAVWACGKPAAPIPPGRPITVQAVVTVGGMHDECAALLVALDAWKECPNLADRDLDEVDAWREAAEEDFAAGDKAHADAPSQHAIAVSCHRATGSVHAANERCLAGKPPKRD
ncbi:MAG TPA: hypothetical protein VGF94_29400 [Kofleriaceae bacterium]